MRYELNDYEWTTIKPKLPNTPRSVRRVNDRRVPAGPVRSDGGITTLPSLPVKDYPLVFAR